MRSHDPQQFWNSSICHSLVWLAFEDLTRSFVLFCLSCGICPGVKQCHSFNWKFMLSTVACIYITNYTQGFTFWQCTDINRSPFFVCFFSSPRCDPYCRPNRQRKFGPVPKRWPWIMLQNFPQADEGQQLEICGELSLWAILETVQCDRVDVS